MKEMTDILLPPHLSSIFEAQTFAALISAVQDALTDLLGPDSIQEISLILFHHKSPANCYVINSRTLHKQRLFRPCQLAEPLSEGFPNTPDPQFYPGAPASLVQSAPHQGSPLSTSAPGTVTVPLWAEERALGLLAPGYNPGKIGS